MEDRERKPEWIEELREYFSPIISIISFWAIALFWNWNVVFGELEPVPRLGFGAALSWVVFLHAEVIGMILMSIKRRRLQAEARAQAWVDMMKQARAEARAELVDEIRETARAEARREAQAEAREAQAEAREAQTATREAQAETWEAQAKAREAQAEAREAQAEAREARLEAREARLEARETIRDLERQLREARGESENGA